MWRDENARVKNMLMLGIHWFGIPEFILLKEKQLSTQKVSFAPIRGNRGHVSDMWPQSRCSATNIFGIFW